MPFHRYDHAGYFDEMFEAAGSPRPHYGAVAERLASLRSDEFRARQTAVEAAFMRGGITFTVYSDNEGTERIFPFDCVPRVVRK